MSTESIPSRAWKGFGGFVLAWIAHAAGAYGTGLLFAALLVAADVPPSSDHAMIALGFICLMGALVASISAYLAVKDHNVKAGMRTYWWLLAAIFAFALIGALAS